MQIEQTRDGDSNRKKMSWIEESQSVNLKLYYHTRATNKEEPRKKPRERRILFFCFFSQLCGFTQRTSG